MFSHLRKNNESYISHLLFAGKISLYLSASSTFFLIHSILPFVSIPPVFNIDSMHQKLKEWKEYTDKRVG